jgi:hypothetical protein
LGEALLNRQARPRTRGCHPVFDQYVGGATPAGKSRNPVQYVDSPIDRTLCACGCGNQTPAGRHFIAGHDQKAIHERIAKVGGVVPFLEWFDNTWTENNHCPLRLPPGGNAGCPCDTPTGYSRRRTELRPLSSSPSVKASRRTPESDPPEAGFQEFCA